MTLFTTHRLRAALSLLAVLMLNVSYAQERAISGTVTSEEEGGLPGVNILLKGTTVGTVTDVDGNYRISVEEEDPILVFSAVGYTTEEVSVGNQSTIDMLMLPDITSLSEVVVVGYGTQDRARVTGAISSVSSEEINQLPVPSVEQALQGRAAGVTVTNNGAPGEGANVRIRGIGTVGNNDPLYVIDGVPAGGLNSINPNDIESVEVLKDASAAAIYGSRAANGVILITTKRGQAGDTKVSVDSYYGVQNVWKRLDVLNTAQYIPYATEIQQNAGLPVPSRLSDPEIRNRDIDYQDELFRAAPIQDHNVSVSGGNDRSTFLIGGGYFNQQGTMIGTDFERISLRANSEFKVGSRVKVGQTLTVAFTERNREAGGGTGRSLVEHAIKSPPYQEIYDPNNLGGFNGPDQVDNNDAENPILIQSLITDRNEDVKLLGTAYAEVNIIEGLNFKSLVGLDMNFSYDYGFEPAYVAGDFHSRGFAALDERRRQFTSPLFTNSLTYDRTFGKHTIGLLAVAEQQTFNNRDLRVQGQNPLSNDIRVINGLDPGSVNARGGLTEWALISYIGRANYSFADRYLLSASIRRDGSSRFGTGRKWGTFPSASVGWRLSEEGFMDGVSAISDLKLRASWGETGNQNIGDYQYIPVFSSNFSYQFDGSLAPGTTINALANEIVQWETTTMRNLGVDVGLFNDRVSFSAEYFFNTTEDMLVNVPLATSLGYDNAPSVNAGTVENQGLEFALGVRSGQSDFQWSVNANASFVRNEVVTLGGGEPIPGPQFESDPLTWTEEGEPIAYYFGWQVDRLFQAEDFEEGEDGKLVLREGIPSQGNAAPGDIKFRDINDDGNITNDDRTRIGNPFPDVTYGITATLNYKGFDANIFIQGVSGNEIYFTQLYDLEGMTRVFNAGPGVINRWTPVNTNTDIPRGISGDPNRNTRASDRFLFDGSYARLKNIQIGYSLPTSLLESFGNGFVSNVRVYLGAQNLLTITDYPGYDPEIGSRKGLGGPNNRDQTLGFGIDWGQAPQARTYLVGVQVGF